jgi:antitoxin VapB
METAKVFMNGRSQAVRLPKDCRFGAKEVFVKKVGDMVLLVPKGRSWEVFMAGLTGFSGDFLARRPNERAQVRSGL